MEERTDEWYGSRTPCLVLHDSLAIPFLIHWLEDQLLCQPLLLTTIERYLRTDHVWQRQWGIDPSPTPSATDPTLSPLVSSDRHTTPRPSESTPRRLPISVPGTPLAIPTHTKRPSLASANVLLPRRTRYFTSRRPRRLQQISPSSPTAALIQRRSCVEIRGLRRSPVGLGSNRHATPPPRGGAPSKSVQSHSPSSSTSLQPRLKYRRLSRIVVFSCIGGYKDRRIRWTR